MDKAVVKKVNEIAKKIKAEKNAEQRQVMFDELKGLVNESLNKIKSQSIDVRIKVQDTLDKIQMLVDEKKTQKESENAEKQEESSILKKAFEEAKKADFSSFSLNGKNVSVIVDKQNGKTGNVVVLVEGETLKEGHVSKDKSRTGWPMDNVHTTPYSLYAFGEDGKFCRVSGESQSWQDGYQGGDKHTNEFFQKSVDEFDGKKFTPSKKERKLPSLENVVNEVNTRKAEVNKDKVADFDGMQPE